MLLFVFMHAPPPSTWWGWLFAFAVFAHKNAKKNLFINHWVCFQTFKICIYIHIFLLSTYTDYIFGEFYFPYPDADPRDGHSMEMFLFAAGQWRQMTHSSDGSSHLDQRIKLSKLEMFLINLFYWHVRPLNILSGNPFVCDYEDNQQLPVLVCNWDN